ncbi:MAG: C1 family peptidase [Candidatus Thermoplasmatota archaeon]|nr:C1 family peptidase [Candidatus Thermoplasmatota archaeon]MDD5778590.1 C1 family peptidase [Candidatus Thermoplasmatota archaeon]
MKKTAVILVIILVSSVGPALAHTGEGSTEQDLPSFFSWRNVDGTDYTTPVKNQAPAPTCEAYALVAAMETLMQYHLQSLYEPDLSETHLYFYAGGTYEAGYVNLVDAANYLLETGVPDEGCYPDPHRPFDYPFESLPGWENRTVKIAEWGWVELTPEAIKTALIEHGPLVLCMYFWQDFYYYRGGVYEHRWGARAGGHVMTIVGYDDHERCWIIKNSWGKDWGEDGWVRISYDVDMIADWYGENTGVMYIDGVYGALRPDVPRVQIVQPTIYHTYLFGLELPTLFRNIPLMQEAAPRVAGSYPVVAVAENTHTVEFYLDGQLAHVDREEPFEMMLDADPGIHTITALAHNENNSSQDIVDVFVLW